MTTYSLAALARQDVQAIRNYTLSQWGEAQARIYLTGLREKLTHIAANPHIGTKRNSIMEGLFSFPYKKHILYYTINSNRVIIVRILHEKMDPAARFPLNP